MNGYVTYLAPSRLDVLGLGLGLPSCAWGKPFLWGKVARFHSLKCPSPNISGSSQVSVVASFEVSCCKGCICSPGVIPCIPQARQSYTPEAVDLSLQITPYHSPSLSYSVIVSDNTALELMIRFDSTLLRCSEYRGCFKQSVS